LVARAGKENDIGERYREFMVVL